MEVTPNVAPAAACVPAWKFQSPKDSSTLTVPVVSAVVTVSRVIELSVSETIFVPGWMPVPLTVWPTAKPTVLLTLISALRASCEAVALATVSRNVVPAAS